MKYLSLLFLSIFLCNISRAEDLQLRYITKDQPAFFTGYIMTEEYEKKFRLLDSDLKYEQTLNSSLIRINKLYDDNVNLMQERVEKQQKHINELQDKLATSKDGFFINTGYFLLGCTLTTVLVFAISRTTK